MIRLLTGFAAFPAVGYLFLAGFAWHASDVVDHWPTCNNPDPKALPLPGLDPQSGSSFWRR